MKSSKQRPLGRILYIVDGEAITRPEKAFVGKNARVFLNTDEEIGVLNDPFGNTHQPYQAIKLKNPDDMFVLGKHAFAVLKSKKRGRRSRGKRRRKNS
ncbi:MAG: hypothetical protein ACXAD7_00735 [Candidatus Kariarchaeaceae archaeon]|jgi:rRNA processing protein Gar1